MFGSVTNCSKIGWVRKSSNNFLHISDNLKSLKQNSPNYIITVMSVSKAILRYAGSSEISLHMVVTSIYRALSYFWCFKSTNWPILLALFTDQRKQRNYVRVKSISIIFSLMYWLLLSFHLKQPGCVLRLLNFLLFVPRNPKKLKNVCWYVSTR